MSLTFSEGGLYDGKPPDKQSPQNGPRGVPRRINVDTAEVVGSGLTRTCLVMLLSTGNADEQPLPNF